MLGQAIARCLARADVVQKPEIDAAIQALSEQIASTFDALGSRLDSKASINNDNQEAVLAAIKSAVSEIDAASIAREEARENAAIAREQAVIARVEASESAAIAREQAAIARVEASENTL